MNLKRAFVLVTMSVVTFWSLIPFALSVRALIFAELVHKSNCGQGESTYQYSGSHINSITKQLFVSSSVKHNHKSAIKQEK